jgi:transcriptional regulator with XRE-family HTH domain
MAIRQLREQRGMSQEQLGALVDLHPTWVSRIETGIGDTSWTQLRRIAKALGVDDRDLVDLACELRPESN